MSEPKRAKLYMKEGSADKEYHLVIKEHEGSYVVEAAWGRRGQTLQHGDKCKPTSYAEANKVFDKTVKEKLAKGYQHADKPAGEPEKFLRDHIEIIPVGFEKPATERWLPQLLNPLTEGEAEAYLRRVESDHWCAQEKMDGHHKIIVKVQGVITALNKQGQPTTIAAEIADYAKTIMGDFVMDGEAIGPDFYAFDLLSHHGVDLRTLTYADRYKSLAKLVGQPNGWPIHLLPLVTGENKIRKFIAELRERKAEGFVLKDLLASHTTGRPNSGGAMLKVKFVATCSAIVIAQNPQRSVLVALYINPTQGIPIGNVTIPPNYRVPQVGDVVEIRYLNYQEGGALYQPVYLGERDDVPATDCTFKKQNLKLKAATDPAGL